MTPLWSNGQVSLYQGDCLQVWPAVGVVDHVICDPPYSEWVHSKEWQGHALTAQGKRRTKTAFAGLGFAALRPETRQSVCALAATLCRRWFAAFTDLESLGAWRADLEAAGLDWARACVWDKIDSAPQFTGDRPASSCEGIALGHTRGKKRWNGGGKRGLYRHPVNSSPGGQREGKPFPSTKPLALMVELLEDLTDPGELVLDPFAGSGSTLVAALRCGRRAIGIEMDPETAGVARQRLEAEAAGSTLGALRAGQLALFGGSR